MPSLEVGERVCSWSERHRECGTGGWVGGGNDCRHAVDTATRDSDRRWEVHAAQGPSDPPETRTTDTPGQRWSTEAHDLIDMIVEGFPAALRHRQGAAQRV